MTDRFESILDESISALQAGVPMEEILAEVPEYADDLRPLLYASMLLADPNPELVPEAQKAALRAEYLTQAASLPPVPPTAAKQLAAVWEVIKKRFTLDAALKDVATVIITIILTLVMAGFVLHFAAQDAIPGDFLYGAKQASERVQYAVTFDEARRQALQETFNQRRLAEIEQLIAQNRASVVRFQGLLETRGESLWVIEGYTVFLPDDVTLEGNPQEGDDVEVVGLLRTNNVLVADTIRQIR